MTYDRGPFDQGMVGCPVFTMDGDQLGEVKEIRGRAFKVDAPLQPDYWLSADCVRSSSGGRVTLAFDKDHLGDYKLDNPDDASGFSSASGTMTGPATTSTVPASRAGEYTDTTRTDSTTSGRPTATGTGMGATATTGAASAYAGTTEITGRSWNDWSPTYRRDWESRYGASGGRWEDAEPGYRYGHEMAADSRYQGREWNDAEPELRGGYGDWSRRQGYQHDHNAWERTKAHTREAWDRMRGRG